MTTESFGVPGAPDAELSRSPAAAAVGQMAAASGLLLSHFEHRVHLPAPDHWGMTAHDAEAGVWKRGVLPESKYGHFRHDNIVGSFHPGHRAKWTAHELCHCLVGFAWRPGASGLFHALAARLAEIVPVALWYFFDEAGLRRCPAHAGQGALFGTFCAACEAAARGGPAPPGADDARWIAEGRAFVERELKAVRRSRARGTPVPNRWATIDLASDGLAYATAHGPRLASPEMAEFVERFHAGRGTWHRTLDALEDRVIEVMEALAGGPAAAPLTGGRDAWIAQALGWRLLQIRSETEGEPARAIDGFVERLATAPGRDTFAAVMDGYRALYDDWILPDPDDVFAVGYDLPGGHGRSIRQVAAGVESVCPSALLLLDEDEDAVIAEFVRADAPERRPLGRRFAAFLRRTRPGPAADVAAFEAALAQPPPGDPTAGLGTTGARDDRRRWADGLELLRCGVDVVALTDALQAEADDAPSPADRPVRLVVGRAPDGELVLAEISEAAAASLERGEVPVDLPPDERESLESLGLLVPVAWEAD